jgi:hypothetical protein
MRCEVPCRRAAACARMIAKIAHAFAVADQGLDKFTPLLPDVVLGRSDNLADLIGGEMPCPPLRTRFTDCILRLDGSTALTIRNLVYLAMCSF